MIYVKNLIYPQTSAKKTLNVGRPEIVKEKTAGRTMRLC